jgi:hypothetical protein
MDHKGVMVKTHRPLQVSVWTMLLGSTLLTGYFAGYQTGGRTQSQLAVPPHVSARHYRVDDIVRGTRDPSGDLRRIIALIKQNVEPESWSQPGVGALPLDANASLIIQHTTAIHEKIDHLLSQLRELQATASNRIFPTQPA